MSTATDLAADAPTLLDRLESGREALTARETEIARYVIAHYPESCLDSASAMARATGVSAATVVRLFAKLGYASFQEVQQEVRREVSRKLHSPAERVRLPEDGVSQGEITARTLETEIDNIRATFAALSDREIEAIVARLCAGRGRIYVIGEKNSFPIAYYIQTHLNLCLPDVTLLETGEARIADRLLWLTPDDLLIAISIRRYSPNTTRAAASLRELGGDVIALTDSPLSPLCPYATHRLLIETRSQSVFDSFTAAMSLSGLIVGAVARRRREAMLEILRRGERLYETFGTFLG
ncbi:MurR/RpiR family transcriptional regulator [Methylobacterium terricola]|uniref:MurR/RpiR family transcriptional regulator n=1 Tax=Methylobacterium terricola TaxID=2583531 RepID=UPI001486D855|nr:MurR/RpiR family transcriptional regulator [Methylobacterium terricola]